MSESVGTLAGYYMIAPETHLTFFASVEQERRILDSDSELKSHVATLLSLII